jgi:hypothetical protein
MRLAQRTSTQAQLGAAGPLASLGRKATMGHHQQESLCFLNFKEKRFVGRLQLHREGDKW